MTAEDYELQEYIKALHLTFGQNKIKELQSLIRTIPQERVDAFMEEFHNLPYIEPRKALRVSIFGFGFDRLMFQQPIIAILKFITAGMFGAWWAYDIVTAKDRAKKYNYKLAIKTIEKYK